MREVVRGNKHNLRKYANRTNQCHSFAWTDLCDLQIFSGYVCHLEQLHTQSPFLFPIVFGINLIHLKISNKLAGDVACLGGSMVEHQPRLLGSRVRFPAGAFAIFPFLPKLHFQSPFSLFPSSFFPFLFLSLRPFVCALKFDSSFRYWLRSTRCPSLGYALLYHVTWATVQSHLSLFVDLSLRAATSNLSLFPNPLSSESVIHDGRKHKTVVFLQPNAVCEQARTPYKFAAFRRCYRLPTMA